MIHLILNVLLLIVIVGLTFWGNYIYKHWTDGPDDDDEKKTKPADHDER